jgi:putative peptide zinc metalloprotease protein
MTTAQLTAARPRLRGDLVLGPAVRDGTGWTHTVKDPRSGWYFQVGPREYFIMSRLDGDRSVGDISGEYTARFGRRLADSHWQQILGMLATRHLLAGTDDERSLTRMAEAARRQRLGTPTLLYRRFPLTDPDRALRRLEPFARPLFSRWFVVPALVAALAVETLVAFSAVALYHQVRADWHYAPAWIAYVVIMWLGLVLHEAAHGITSRHYGGASSELGILWRFPFLAPYCKADDVLLFGNKWHRVYTAFAGVFTNLVLLLPFSVLWLAAAPGSTVRALAAPLVLFGGVAALANLVPFLQLDGYYMLSHALGMVNLRTASNRYWAQAVRAALRRGGPVAYPRGARMAYILYGGASFVLFAGLAGWGLTAWYLWLARHFGTAAIWMTLGIVALAALAGLIAARQARRGARRLPPSAAEAVRQLDAAAPGEEWQRRGGPDATAAQRASPAPGPQGAAPVLSAEPASALIDVPPRITVSGLAPGAEVTIRASMTDGARVAWRSSASFAAGQDGTVDVATQAPSGGSYTGADASGLLWSMRPAGGRQGVFFSRRKPRPIRVELSAETAGATVARGSIERTFAGTEVAARPADAGQLTGTLYYRSAAGPEPGVLVLGGSDGGQPDHAAALLAAHGFAVLALTYFGAEDLPPRLHNVDLGYLTAALDWLTGQPEVRAGPVGVAGLSRGAELALQVASMDDRVGAVVAGSPSSVRQPGLTRKFTDYRQPAWVASGAALPFLPGRFTARDALSFMAVWLLGRPLRLSRNFSRSLGRDAGAVARATIEVERIRGPVLLISGSDDQLWPSAEFARRALARLHQHGHPYPDEWLNYPDAGHFACFPYGLPALPPMTTMSPAPRLVIDFGGTTAANARSASESWPRILSFLAGHLDGTPPA